MINPESKTMREFSFSLTTKKGEQLKVFFAYDMSAYHSGYFVSVSSNGSKPKTDVNAIKKVRNLNIPAMNTLIESIGCDVTGAPYDIDTTSHEVVKTAGDLAAFYRIKDDASLTALTSMLSAYQKTKVEATRKSIVNRFNKNLRLRLLDISRDRVRQIRELYLDGFDYNGTHITLQLEGMLRQKHNPTYYKRDIDYIRKARARLFKHVLKREYKPFAN